MFQSLHIANAIRSRCAGSSSCGMPLDMAGSVTVVIGARGNIASPLGANRMSHPAASASGKSCPASRSYVIVVLGRHDRSPGAPPQYSAVMSFSAAACRMSDWWPACIPPLVPTMPIRLPRARSGSSTARSSLTVRYCSIASALPSTRSDRPACRRSRARAMPGDTARHRRSSVRCRSRTSTRPTPGTRRPLRCRPARQSGAA